MSSDVLVGLVSLTILIVALWIMKARESDQRTATMEVGLYLVAALIMAVIVVFLEVWGMLLLSLLALVAVVYIVRKEG